MASKVLLKVTKEDIRQCFTNDGEIITLFQDWMDNKSDTDCMSLITFNKYFIILNSIKESISEENSSFESIKIFKKLYDALDYDIKRESFNPVDIVFFQEGDITFQLIDYNNYKPITLPESLSDDIYKNTLVIDPVEFWSNEENVKNFMGICSFPITSVLKDMKFPESKISLRNIEEDHYCNDEIDDDVDYDDDDLDEDTDNMGDLTSAFVHAYCVSNIETLDLNKILPHNTFVSNTSYVFLKNNNINKLIYLYNFNREDFYKVLEIFKYDDNSIPKDIFSPLELFVIIEETLNIDVVDEIEVISLTKDEVLDYGWYY